MPDPKSKEELKQVTEDLTFNEVILFCGNSGSGKSSLCNSIFNTAVFKSGYSPVKGITQNKQEYEYEKKIYIDTPGLSDITSTQEATKQIDKALENLKKYNSSKIIFVITLESGRLRAADLATIRMICEAITANFEYGVIINKVSDEAIRKIEQAGSIQEVLRPYLNYFPKNISLNNFLLIKKDSEMEDKDNILLTDSEERRKLIDFISKLKANNIKPGDLQKIDVTDYEEKAQALQKEWDKVNQIEYSIGRKILSTLTNVGSLISSTFLYATHASQTREDETGIPMDPKEDSETMDDVTDRATGRYEQDDDQTTGSAASGVRTEGPTGPNKQGESSPKDRWLALGPLVLANEASKFGEFIDLSIYKLTLSETATSEGTEGPTGLNKQNGNQTTGTATSEGSEGSEGPTSPNGDSQVKDNGTNRTFDPFYADLYW